MKTAFNQLRCIHCDRDVHYTEPADGSAPVLVTAGGFSSCYKVGHWASDSHKVMNPAAALGMGAAAVREAAVRHGRQVPPVVSDHDRELRASWDLHDAQCRMEALRSRILALNIELHNAQCDAESAMVELRRVRAV